jgi:regulation of enolase protein 1 (concanavalin A-like superfamily)
MAVAVAVAWAVALVGMSPSVAESTAGPATPTVAMSQSPPSWFTGVTPARILDTRFGPVPTQHPVGQPLAGPASIDLQVSGVAGVPAGATAVALNVTSVQATDSKGFVTVWPTGEPRPLASNLNMQPGANVPNLVTVKVGAGGKVSLYTNIGSVHLVSDVVGYWTVTDGDGFTGLTPARILDTRSSPVPPGYTSGSKLPGGDDIELPVVGVGGVPSGASSVVLNVTSTEATDARGFVTVWPTGQTRPLASSLNLRPGVNAPNLVIAKVGAGGKVSLYTNIGAVHLVADVVGYFAPGSGDGFDGVVPTRILDTRSAPVPSGYPGGKPLAGGDAPLELQVTGGAVPTGAKAAILNVTSTQATMAEGFVTVFPADEARPLASNLNVLPGVNVPNLVMVKLSGAGKVKLYTNVGSTHLVVDVVGYYPDSDAAFQSDDFSTGVLGPHWNVIDPLGDGSVGFTGPGSADARLALAVPGPAAHDALVPNNTLRVMQPLRPGDFEAEAKFDAAPTARFQQQGILVEQDADDWLRADYYHDGTQLKLYVATFAAGVRSVRADVGVPGPAAGSLWLRVARVGTGWTVSTSADGSTWTQRASFSSPLAPSSIGVFAGNAPQGSAPPFSTLVDYFFDTSAPVVPEDFPGPDTVDPVVVSGPSVAPGSGWAVVTWTTDEASTSLVDYGLTTGLGSSTSSPQWVTEHAVLLTGLSPSTTYWAKVTSADPSGNVTSSGLFSFATTAGPTGPVIDVWYGPVQSSGFPGSTQRWVNVLGNVSGPQAIQSLTYRLNGGQPKPLSMGPNNRRLQRSGDFNVDLLVTELVPGGNTVTITAVDEGGATSSTDVTINHTVGATWPNPYTIDWGSVSSLTSASHIVDGKFRIEGNGLRTDQVGYDRLVAVGSQSWTDYQVTVPMTIHSIVSPTTSYSGQPLVGFLLRWNGHNDTKEPGSQPQQGWVSDGVNPTPFGAAAVIRYRSAGPRLELWDHGAIVRRTSSRPSFTPGGTYVFKADVVTLTDGTTRYRMKVWSSTDPEPAVWDLEYIAGTDDYQPSSGSIVLDAHEADVTFGTVSVTAA